MLSNDYETVFSRLNWIQFFARSSLVAFGWNIVEAFSQKLMRKLMKENLEFSTHKKKKSEKKKEKLFSYFARSSIWMGELQATARANEATVKTPIRSKCGRRQAIFEKATNKRFKIVFEMTRETSRLFESTRNRSVRLEQCTRKIAGNTTELANDFTAGIIDESVADRTDDSRDD